MARKAEANVVPGGTAVGYGALSPTSPAPSSDLAARVEASGLRRVHLLAWRDLEDVEAGGSEVHAHEIAKRWAAAGLDVTLRTSYAQGRAARVERDGYKVVRKAGRYLVFPRAVLSEIAERHGPWDAIVEIWNGVPFFSPLWTRTKPSIVFLHHVHAEMWRMVMPENERLARAGELLESRLAPPFYRRSPIVTLSESSKRELVHDLGFRPDKVTVVPPGIHPRFTPGGRRDDDPLVCAVGRLVPVKRYDRLIEAMDEVRREHQPNARLVIVGEGYERPVLEQRIRDLDAGDWVDLPGRLSDTDVIDLYRRSWLVASASAREGWGMTATEAAACGTPAVMTDIAGHRDAVVDGETGLLAGDLDDLADQIARVLGDEVLRKSLAEAALERASGLTWDATASGAFEVLAAEAARRARRR
jgi:glycosyltransferase involved in cell wall biosynthesis